jgi:HK97 family phage major capsid protein
MTLAELRAAVRSALERMETADQALTDAGEDADHDSLQAEFDSAEQAHTDARSALEAAEAAEERTNRVAEARRNAPVDPVGDDPEERGDPARPNGSTTEPSTYERHGRHSFFQDVAEARFGDSPEARERLERHGRETAQERAISSTAGAGGEFIPPVWMQSEWVNLARASRAVADTFRHIPFQGGTNSINLPKVSGGATVAAQVDAGAVSSTDITTTSVTGAVQTVAGQQDGSVQLVDLSVPGIDEVIFDDLGRAYNAKLDSLVLNGTVTNAKGIDQLASTNGVTYTDASPTGPELYPNIAGGVSQVAGGRFLPPSVVAMHPRRWYWLASQLDSNNRPLVVPSGAGLNQAAVLERVAAESVVGEILGLPVVLDPNITTTAGGGTEDRIYVYRAEDIYLWETPTPKLRVFEEVLSNTLQVRFQVYGYYAIIAGRYPKAISVVSGTGLAAPSGF